MKIKDIPHQRLKNLRLEGAPFSEPADVVSWLCAVQSQDYGPAKWSVATRTRGLTDEALDQAFADGALLRTHVLRPTWHFVTPADIRWMLELTGPRVHKLNAHYYKQLGLDDDVLKRSVRSISRALRADTQMTRKELQIVLAKAGVEADGLRLGYVMMNAELRGVICSGALRGKQHTYALVEERAPGARTLTRDQALTELIVRYFSSHGPATVKDLRSWSSLTITDIKRGLEMVGPQLQTEVIDGVSYWFAASSPLRKQLSPKFHLMQGYDEYIMGYSESKHLLNLSGVARSLPKGQIAFNNVIILDGQFAGHWKRTLKKDSVIIETFLYDSPSGRERKALRTEADRHGRFLERPVELAELGRATNS